MDIRALIKGEVLSQKAYPVDNASCRIKLDANENPLAMPEELRERFAALLASVPLNRYPEAGSVTLTSRFAKAFGVDADQVMIGNGSDELIQILYTALARSGAEVMIPVPTFAMYRISGLNAGFRVAEVPLDSRFDLDLAAMRERAASHPPVLTFLAYPNNPTGNCFSRGEDRSDSPGGFGHRRRGRGLFPFRPKDLPAAPGQAGKPGRPPNTLQGGPRSDADRPPHRPGDPGS